jgi:pimeloyl-ACP methyl ester carboxylesterase
VKKLILIGCPPFESKYGDQVIQTRLKRMTNEQRKQVQSLILESQNTKNNKDDFQKLITQFMTIDAYHSIEKISNFSKRVHFDYTIYNTIWQEAEKKRDNGTLLKYGKKITCPVVAIHGDYDPHPREGVQMPLSTVLKDFTFIPVKKCGHRPWIEQYAQTQFYQILLEQLK